ncbi:MAG: lytic murein transglycosylase [Proteobacteria bacterium]|nr:lytic murein transglycosylase [Pseudomonadota bacterium]MBU1387253.1 lytic murein transglycosylase [Pseudomonadota bacterium]MBU1544913.1 lytic murein transglycosylase [Pseudomonadota bacterium]MBU2430658.1 lytic murein transglycosylase [Pseudomonadota bacterium]
MTIKTPYFDIQSIIIFILFLVFSAPLSGQEIQKNSEFDVLIQQLVSDGFEKKNIKTLFSDKDIFFNPEGVSKFFIHSESSLNYDQFASKKSIAKAKQYLAKYRTTLDQAQKTHGVDKTVITAILLVETRLGTYVGNRTVINTLATMASLSDNTLKEKIWNAVPEEKRNNRQLFDKKVKYRSKWAYEELKALLEYAARQNIHPKTIRGSYAGAMGIPQFMPSNALKLAEDGNNDGKIDLFTHEDAIFSIANYLKHHGWKPGISREKQKKVLFAYNHSVYYVDILLRISDKLKG